MNLVELNIEKADMQKLLGAASGDAALLYLYVHCGNDPQQAEQGGVHQSGRNPVDAIFGIVQHEVQNNHCQHSHHNTADTVSVERDTQHANAGNE